MWKPWGASPAQTCQNPRMSDAGGGRGRRAELLGAVFLIPPVLCGLLGKVPDWGVVKA